jgi:hypothetical protein
VKYIINKWGKIKVQASKRGVIEIINGDNEHLSINKVPGVSVKVIDNNTIELTQKVPVPYLPVYLHVKDLHNAAPALKKYIEEELCSIQ